MGAKFRMEITNFIEANLHKIYAPCTTVICTVLSVLRNAVINCTHFYSIVQNFIMCFLTHLSLTEHLVWTNVCVPFPKEYYLKTASDSTR